MISVRKNIMRVFAAIAAAAAIVPAGVTGASASSAAFRIPQAARMPDGGRSHAPAASGTRLWVSRFNGPANRHDRAAAVAVGPGGRTVFVTGSTQTARSGDNYATVAYNAATGAQRWVSRYNGPANGSDGAVSLAVSPSGKTVFVTGDSDGGASGFDYATVAYSAATGAQRWVKRYNGPASKEDTAASVAVSPTGKTVFVTGRSSTATNGEDYATVAYSAATGAQRWVKRYNGPANRADAASAVAVSPSGKTVFVTGTSNGGASGYDYATVAYPAATGARLWTKRYNGPASDDGAPSVAVSPGGGTVFVTGASHGPQGQRLRHGRLQRHHRRPAVGQALRQPRSQRQQRRFADCQPLGGSVFVTGFSDGGASGDDYATVAYNAATGARRWAARYNGPSNLLTPPLRWPSARRGGKVFVTGDSVGAATGDDYATVAYNATTGTQLWARRYNGPANRADGATSVAVSPAGGKVFVTGSSTGSASRSDYATIGYRS